MTRTARSSRNTAIFVAIALLTGCASVSNFWHTTSVKLEGAQEVPPVTTSAKGEGEFTVADRSISGQVTVSGMTPTAAHIHMGEAGKSGTVIVPLAKTAANTFSVPAGVKLTDAQFEAYKKNNLYVNVHSKAHPNGELRGQIKPPMF